jgi:glycerophosphoryl diester phosphodiesterase
MIELNYANTGKILVQGHRGAMGYAPENTMSSFVLGYELGADLIELDIHLSADNKIFVMHDSDVSRTTNGLGYIENLTSSELEILDAGSWFSDKYKGEKIPLLKDVLEWAHDKINLIIEIKGNPQPNNLICEELLKQVYEYSMSDQVMVISFYHQSVKDIKILDSSIATGILYTGSPIHPCKMAIDAYAESIRPSIKYLTKEIADKAHKDGLCVSAWIGNTEKEFQTFVDAGVDSIGCNYPDRLRLWLDNHGLGV